MERDEGFPNIHAEIAGDGLHARDGADALAAVEQGPAGEIQFLLFRPFSLDVETTADNFLGVRQGSDVVQMDDGLGGA